MIGVAIQIVPVGSDGLERVMRILERVDLYTTSVTLTGSSYWIAVQDGQDVGCIGLEHGDGASLLRSAAVLPEFRSSGLGRRLTEHALEAARGRGDRAVYLFTSDMGPFWERFGFREVPPEQLTGALPEVPQVKSGMCRGWLVQTRTWMCPLELEVI